MRSPMPLQSTPIRLHGRVQVAHPTLGSAHGFLKTFTPTRSIIANTARRLLGVEIFKLGVYDA